MTETTGWIVIDPNTQNQGVVEPAWAPLIRELTARVEELERREAINATLIERFDRELTELFIDMSMIRSGGALHER